MEEGIALSVCTSLMSRAERTWFGCAGEELGARRTVPVAGRAGDGSPSRAQLCG